MFCRRQMTENNIYCLVINIIMDINKLNIDKYLRTTRTRKWDGRKDQPWRIYREAKEGRTITPKELLDLISRNDTCAARNPQTKAFASFLYLFGLRVQEGCRYSYSSKYKKEVSLWLPSPRVKDIWVENDGQGRQWIWASLRREKVNKIKNKVVNDLKINNYPLFLQIKKKSLFPRTDKIKILNDGIDSEFASFIDNWIDIVCQRGDRKSEMNKNKELFPFGRVWAEKRIKTLLNFPPHLLRCLRAEHLTIYKNFSASDLQKFIGWATPNQALEYAQSNEWTIGNRFIEGLEREKERSIEDIEFNNPTPKEEIKEQKAEIPIIENFEEDEIEEEVREIPSLIVKDENENFEKAVKDFEETK